MPGGDYLSLSPRPAMFQVQKNSTDQVYKERFLFSVVSGGDYPLCHPAPPCSRCRRTAQPWCTRSLFGVVSGGDYPPLSPRPRPVPGAEEQHRSRVQGTVPLQRGVARPCREDAPAAGLLERQVRSQQAAGRDGPQAGRPRHSQPDTHLDEPTRHGRGEGAGRYGGLWSDDLWNLFRSCSMMGGGIFRSSGTMSGGFSSGVMARWAVESVQGQNLFRSRTDHLVYFFA